MTHPTDDKKQDFNCPLSPSPYDLGVMAGQLQVITAEIEFLKISIASRVTTAEFTRSIRTQNTILFLVLAAVLGVIFK